MARRTFLLGLALSVGLTACGGPSTRASWPDVASTDRSADDLGLPAVEEPSGADMDTNTDSGTGTGSGTGSGTGTEAGA